MSETQYRDSQRVCLLARIPQIIKERYILYVVYIYIYTIHKLNARLIKESPTHTKAVFIIIRLRGEYGSCLPIADSSVLSITSNSTSPPTRPQDKLIYILMRSVFLHQSQSHIPVRISFAEYYRVQRRKIRQ